MRTPNEYSNLSKLKLCSCRAGAACVSPAIPKGEGVKSQTDQILDEVWLRGLSITPAQAYEVYGCLALHSRASEARDRGFNIRCQIKTGGGRRWGSYTLVMSSMGTEETDSALDATEPRHVDHAPSVAVP